jgi:hypothetical protein
MFAAHFKKRASDRRSPHVNRKNSRAPILSACIPLKVSIRHSK